MIVMKFGGTSVQDAKAIERAAAIVKGRAAQKPVVVVSAMAKVTDQFQGIEGDADKLELERLRDLFKGDHSAKQIIFLHDLYGLLEKVIDRCRDAGNIIVQVALKYA